MQVLTLHTDWPTEEELGSSGAGTTHLWEESWDDDDTSNEFSVQLKYTPLLQPAMRLKHTDKALQRRAEEDGRQVRMERALYLKSIVCRASLAANEDEMDMGR